MHTASKLSLARYILVVLVLLYSCLLVSCTSESEKYYKQAEAHRKLKRYDEAITAYQKAIEAEPNYASAHYGLGLVYEQQNKLEEAEKKYQKTLELNPADKNARTRLLCVEGKLAFNNHDYKQAINKFQAIETDLLTADEKSMIAEAYYEEGIYDKAFALIPGKQKYRYSYACALYKSGNYEEAEKEFEALADYRDSTQYRKICIEKIMPLKIETLSDFENSLFYRYYYKLKKGSGWKLRSGGYNNTYDVISISPSVLLEITTVDDKVVGFGITFYERQELRERDLELVYRLLESIDTQVKLTDKIKKFIKRNAEKSVFQIREANSITFNGFKIWAGKVGKEQTISIDRLGKAQLLKEHKVKEHKVTIKPYKGSSALVWEYAGGGAEFGNRVKFEISKPVIVKVISTTRYTVPGTIRTYTWYHIDTNRGDGWVMDIYVEP